MKQIKNTSYFVTPCGAIVSGKNKEMRHLRHTLAGPGYPYVTLRIDGKNVGVAVHRLVADAYVAPVDGLTVDHLNFDKADNCVWNLEVVPHLVNMRRAHAAGRIPLHIENLQRTKPGALNKRRRDARGRLL